LVERHKPQPLKFPDAFLNRASRAGQASPQTGPGEGPGEGSGVGLEQEVEVEDEPVFGKQGKESRSTESSKEADLSRFAHFWKRG